MVKPLIKKSNLDTADFNNYRPISNLPFLAKILEKVVFKQISNFIKNSNILETFQSVCREHHSTETLIKVLNDIRINSDSNNLSILVLLDLSAAFDTVDHCVLLNRLENWVGLSGMVLQWFRSYLTGCEFSGTLGDLISDKNSIACGVPQGSILDPILFNLYMLPFGEIIRN